MEIFGIQPQVWFPVITLIIGAVLKAAFDALTDRRTLRREREARQEQRQDAFRLRRVEFQRVTLLELQEVISQLMRYTAQSHYQNVLAFRSSGKWQDRPLTEGINEGFRKNQERRHLLQARVRDPKVIELTERISIACADVVLSTNETASEHALRLVDSAQSELNEKIGVVLRKLDDDEDRIGDNSR